MWQGEVCMAGEHVWYGGSMAGSVHGGHAWQGVCLTGGAWQGDMCSRGHA